MAQITGAQNERVFSIQKWLGLNQNPDGDTKLKYGEAASMRNFKVTRDGNLQKRPGTTEVVHLAYDNGDPVEDSCSAVWTGFVGGAEVVMVICGKVLYSCWDTEDGFSNPQAVKTFTNEPDYPHMFGFSGKLYVIADGDYWEWEGLKADGTPKPLTSVVGYKPLVAVAIPPNGGGELLEQVNKLNGYRRAWLSPTGNTDKTFILPDSYAIAGVDYVKDLGTDTDLTVNTDYTVDLANRTVTFTSAVTLTEGTNSYEVGWHVTDTFRSEITNMHFSEFYNGNQDTRVFLYGDGSAEAIYSDLDYDGVARADYFPDLNEIRVGVENTPLTGLVRQYSRLIAFKSDGTWSISFGQITDTQGNSIPGFYATPVNKTIGHEMMGYAQLVLNDPVTLFGQDLYEWKSGSYGNLTNDERNAKL
jgi:hypothetical protein